MAGQGYTTHVLWVMQDSKGTTSDERIEMTISGFANRVGASSRIKPGRNKGVQRDYREDKREAAEERQTAYREEFPEGHSFNLSVVDAKGHPVPNKPGRKLREGIV